MYKAISRHFFLAQEIENNRKFSSGEKCKMRKVLAP